MSRLFSAFSSTKTTAQSVHCLISGTSLEIWNMAIIFLLSFMRYIKGLSTFTSFISITALLLRLPAIYVYITKQQLGLINCLALEGIHKLIRWQAKGGRMSPKCQRYYISLFCKLVNEGGDSVNVVYGCPLITQTINAVC